MKEKFWFQFYSNDRAILKKYFIADSKEKAFSLADNYLKRNSIKYDDWQFLE